MTPTVLPTAFILQTHKNPAQVNTFINQLTSTSLSDVFVHIDKKNHRKIASKIVDSTHVTVLDDCCEVSWGDISQVDATIKLLRAVLASDVKYDFVCHRSGQDLLVKNGLKDHLSKNEDKIYMTTALIKDDDISASHLNIKWFKRARRQYNAFHPIRIYRRTMMYMYKKGFLLFPNDRKLPKGFSLYHGSSWFCFPLDVARHVVEFVDHNKWYYEYFENALCPDEWFFQTLLMNSKYAKQIANDNLTYIKWGDTYKTSNHPLILGAKDIESIEKSNKFFARKFDQNEDEETVRYYSETICM